jgi:glycosyltransferase involved in cell wall biosynthesis
MVSFDDQYRTVPSLLELIGQSTCVVLPYDSEDQITSGVLVDAVSAGRPVIATGFPHAVELLAGGVGIVVPHQDPVAMASAIRAVVSNPRLVDSMAEATQTLASDHRWTAVAARYADVSSQLAPTKALVF